MKFNELVRLLEQNDFRIVGEGLDTALWQNRPAATDSRGLPRLQGDTDRHLPEHLTGPTRERLHGYH